MSDSLGGITIDRVLIANRGAIACRIIRTIKALGKQSVAIYAEDDIDSAHIDLADHCFSLGTGMVSDTYLNQEKIFEIAKQSGAQAIHPGYGFLSENPSFEQRCRELGIAFLGPTSEQIRVFGLKHSARHLASENSVPMLPGSPLLADIDTAIKHAQQIGYPLMLKSTAGGGGIGMRIVHDDDQLKIAFKSVQTLAMNNFGDAGMFLERYVQVARHVEVQLLGDGQGGVISFGTRDCSVQRRQQKVIEECPAPFLSEKVTTQLCRSAESLLSAVNYRSVGTVEFIYDQARDEAYFLEVNTRLQVEHGVTEMVFGVDLVACMIQLAEGKLAPLSELLRNHQPAGVAMQARIYAEDPSANFQPAPGLLTHVAFPDPTDRIRIDTWVEAGTEVSPNYDPMIAKILNHGSDRETAISGLRNALEQTELYGTATNLTYLTHFLSDPEFNFGPLSTGMLANFAPTTPAARILRGGTLTTIQDYPGRVGYWDVGVPPSGPFDDLSFQIGNLLLGNQSSAAGLEITVDGPSLSFMSATEIVLTGAAMDAQLDGEPISNWQVIRVAAGSILDIGRVTSGGLRGYLLINGGIQSPDYLSSKSTFTLGQFGGHCGRGLRVGDLLPLVSPEVSAASNSLQPDQTPFFTEQPGHWNLHVIYGPHGAPDFFTDSDIETFFTTDYEVHFNSGRTGVRLIGPKPEWARNDGGEAGLHPSNIHDNAYAVGAVDFTGDMPVLLGPDGPSLGGFVCPATVIRADLWKLGQLKPGDKIRFRPVTHDQALERFEARSQALSNLTQLKQSHFDVSDLAVASINNAIIETLTLPSGTDIVFRPSGDDFLLMEVGEQKLDIDIRFQVHGAHREMQIRDFDGVLEITPGIRSLQVHYVPEVITRTELIEALKSILLALDDEKTLEVPSRIVYLPLSWDDPVCSEAIDKYVRVVRPDAPWCPSNLDFIRRINGLSEIEDVKNIVFDATYLVMGLGDVYLGAPVATPLNPEHRLVTTKYNPARTWTAENSVGIGGAYLCVYGMEGPGGYQFVGRTIQMWNRYKKTAVFNKPWLLRFFDQIRFYPVSSDELMKLRRDFIRGRYQPKIETTTFNLRQHQTFVSNRSNAIEQFTAQRVKSFADEMSAWRENGQLHFEESVVSIDPDSEIDIPEGCFVIESALSGNVWQRTASVGDEISDSEILLVLESMKMELEVKPDRPGKLVKYLVEPGQQVAAGQALALFSEVA